MTKFVAQYVGAGVALAMTACGGGNGSTGGGVPTAPAFPTNGIYAPVIKVNGSTTSPALGLSLVHPQDPSVEYVIEDGSKPVADTLTLFSGVVSAGSGRVDQVAPHMLLYIVGGLVMGVPLVANGSPPRSAVRGSATLDAIACKFLSEPNANDYGNPDATRIGVITNGPDKVCGTPDDGKTSYQYDSTSNRIGFVGGGSTGNFVRDPKDYSPAYQVDSSGVVVVREKRIYVILPFGLEFRRLVASSPGLAIMELGRSELDSRLVALDVVSRTYAELGSLAAGANWQLIGHDSTAFYVYRNSGTTSTSIWQVLKITKVQPSATRLVSGSGLVSSVAMGQGLLYLTVQQPSSNKLYSIEKASPNALVQLESSALSTLTTVLASAGAIHQFWRVTLAGTTASYRIDMVEEGTGTVRATATNAIPLAMVEPSSVDFSRSENRTKFVHATEFSSLGFSESNLFAFDVGVAGGSGTLLGKLPSAAVLGGSTVFAQTSAPLTGFVAGQVASSSNGSFVSNGSKTFSFKVDTPNSLVFTATLR